MSSSQSQFPTPTSSTNDQDELIARRKLEQKRRFQQKQANAHTNARFTYAINVYRFEITIEKQIHRIL